MNFQFEIKDLKRYMYNLDAENEDEAADKLAEILKIGIDHWNPFDHEVRALLRNKDGGITSFNFKQK